MYIVTTAQMQAAERAANDSGLTYDQMMESAGHAVAKTIEAQFDLSGVRVLVLVGPGNNGGDGLVAARYLAEMGAIVSVYVWKRRLENDKNWALLDTVPVERILSAEPTSEARLNHLLGNTGIIIDALLGTGVSRPIEGTLADLLDRVRDAVNLHRARRESALIDPTLPTLEEEIGPVVVAVDTPSGLNCNTGEVDPHTLPADLTVTLAAVKRGQVLMPGAAVVGQLVVGDIGIRPEHFPDDVRLEMATAFKVARLLPDRPPAAHKGTFGTALIVAGSRCYIGAAGLAALAAGRSGAGLVTLAPPKSIQTALAARVLEATYLPLPDDDGALTPEAVPLVVAQAGKADALLVGPGLGQAGSTAAFLLDLLAQADALPPLVVDADALNILSQQPDWPSLLPPGSILTPHPGEMARLTGSSTGRVQANRLELAQEMAVQWKQIVLLKGAHTVIAAPDGRCMVLPFANPALAKGGSGDVLAGAIVGLLAQGLEPFEAAVAGGYLHGLCGELAAENLGTAGVVAGDLVGYLPLAIREVTGM
ncbi:MAG: NAD(P)H-hydrate dehydratase [Chloroflexi bacterium]|nr:MAG: NAD(P)H-hydrate dehydratase [Chloroflexota bacterium]